MSNKDLKDLYQSYEYLKAKEQENWEAFVAHYKLVTSFIDDEEYAKKKD